MLLIVGELRRKNSTKIMVCNPMKWTGFLKHQPTKEQEGLVELVLVIVTGFTLLQFLKSFFHNLAYQKYFEHLLKVLF